MVYYFKSTVVDPPAFIYVGKDKVESGLISSLIVVVRHWLVPRRRSHKVWLGRGRLVSLTVDNKCVLGAYGCRVLQRIFFPSTTQKAYCPNQQFHVDNLSSAHVYLRMHAGDTWTSIPEELLKDCAQLTKANSIEGNTDCSWMWTPVSCYTPTSQRSYVWI